MSILSFLKFSAADREQEKNTSGRVVIWLLEGRKV